MPAPLAAPLIAAGSSLLGGGINAWQTGRMNRASRRFAREMYARTKADNLEFWNMTNQYNSPQAQMARFQEAGLNPHLIYGQGNSGPAGNIPTPDVQQPQFRTPEWGNAVSGAGLNLVNAMYDLEIKQAQADNLKAQNSVIRQDALLKAAQTEATTTGQQRTAFDLDFSRDLRDVNADFRREQLRQLKVTVDVSIREDARRAALTSSSLAEAAERMKNMSVQRLNMEIERARSEADISRLKAERARIIESIGLMQREGKLKDLDIALRQQGINPNDPMWARIVGQGLQGVVEGSGNWLDDVWKWLSGN